MQKEKSGVVKSLAFGQISIIILAIFSFAFLVSETSLVTSQTYEEGFYDAANGLTENLPLNPSDAYIDGYFDGLDFGKTALNNPAKTGESNILSDLFGGKAFGGGFFGHLTSGLLWGGVAYGAVYLLGSLFGLDDNITSAASAALGIGVAVGRFGYLEAEAGGSIFNSLGFTSTGAVLWTIGIAAVVFVLLYKAESAKRVTFECLPWEAPVGGRNCEECNKDPFRPCSEYRCKSLGQACEIVNPGTTEEQCVWVNPNDANTPTITPWNTPLTEGHRYTNHDTRPPSLGTKIIRTSVTNGCLAPFTPLTFGILTNEPAQCKIDLVHKDTFDEMQFYFGNNNLFAYNHTQRFSLPSPDAINSEVPEIQNDGIYDFFVRCRDKNGNANVDEFAVQFCVDPSPDSTAPVIVDTSIESGSAVRFGVGSVPLEVYVNEPATCKWSTQNKGYDLMENTMNCATSLTQINARELYTCATNLTGIVDRAENKFYFRCRDQPNKPDTDRNTNSASYEFLLKGSQPLNIISAGPNSTITGSTQTVPVDLMVTTDDGAEEGKAICSFSPNGNPGSFIPMFETNSFEHAQRLTLGTGNYNYQFRCVDLGGNAAQANISFNVLVDTFPPIITRAYHDSANNALKIVTNEDAECAYSLNSCNYNFADGIPLDYLNPSKKRSHYAEWQPNFVYYLKCKDLFGNEPAPNSCSLVASATNIS